MKTLYPHHKLTQSQLLLWIGQQMDVSSPMYNMALTFHIQGEIHVDHFRNAFQKLVERSDALRTVFEVRDGSPIQKVLENLEYETALLDFSKEVAPMAAYESWVKDQTKIMFDLSKCLFDSILIRLSETDFIWYFNQHHLTTDAWSTSVIYKELALLYKLSIEDQINLAPPLPSFRDYILFEHTVQNNKAEAYWKNKLADCPPMPLLYNKKLKTSTTASKRITIQLGKERSDKLRQLSNEKGIRSWTQHLSLYNIFATTLFAYLYRICDQESLVMGSPAHNRPSNDFKKTIGLFIETFPLFAQIEQGESFLSLLKRVQIESNGFLRFAQPGTSSPELSRSFNVFFNYINADYSSFNGIPMSSKWIHPEHCDPSHHLRLQVHDFDRSGDIQLYFDLNTGVFDQEKQLAAPKHFLALLDAFIEDKEAAINAIPIITPQEFQKTIIDFNKNRYNTAEEESSIIELIETQVQKTPKKTSIVFKEKSISYQELNKLANQLAHYLSEKEIGLGSQVAICLKRSPEYIISVLAVLKTGATYIPIPSNYPNERVYYLLKDSQAKLLISHSSLTDCMELSPINTLHIDTAQTTLSNYPTENLSKSIPLNAIAFLIYTSGSTGNPKGVMITNKALSSYIKWTKQAYITSPDPAIPLFTTIGFDITANAVFLPLIMGGAIHVYQEVDQAIDISILEVIEDNKVDFVKLTPAHLIFLKGKTFEESQIKVMSVTGDELNTDLAQEVYNAFNGKLLMFDEYGPSEATIGCLYHQFTPTIKTPTVPIGLPIHNMNAYILNDHQIPVPQGVIGELYLSGIGLAAGYWNKPDLTDQKFIPNPFEANTKMYRTGDLARINEEGITEFLGRIDFQVKINGHRIELGEIETHVVSFTSITSCVVLAVDNNLGSKNLVAFFTSPSVILLSKLQAYLASKLPRYMIPSLFRHLEQLPLSPNGKVNRKALSALHAFPIETKIEYTPPQTEIEELIVEIWQTIFNISKIGIHDNFFDLGGESLMAIQITTRISETFEMEIPLSQVFKSPTVSTLAQYVEEKILNLLET